MSNQLIQAKNDVISVHSCLTDKLIDLSNIIYNKKTFTRKHIFEFISDILEDEDSTFSYFFDIRGDRVAIYLTKQDKTTKYIYFVFPPKAIWVNGGWQKFTFREFLISMLKQTATTRTIDYKTSKQFRFYFL